MGVARHDIFMHVKPDICIVDEAGQVSEPIVLGPLFHCSKFILVGDPKQLPPLIRSRKARALDADISLMERLCISTPKLGWFYRPIISPVPDTRTNLRPLKPDKFEN